jgi:hypothetical protein
LSEHEHGLGQLYFGHDDAEMDITEGGLLRDGFLPTETYLAARQARKHLIIGRKGSGKSAICRTIAAETSSDISTIMVTPDEISADELRRFQLQGLTPEKAKELVWRYALLVAVGRWTIRHVGTLSQGHKIPSVDALRKFLIANKEVDDPNFQEKLWQTIQRLKASLSLEAFGIKFGADVSWPSEGIRADSQLDIIVKNVKAALGDLKSGGALPRILILIDQVDDVWSDDPESHQMVVGLLRAARFISVELPMVDCIVFLRADIYDMLQFFDKDKLHGDEMRVDWTASRLTQMILTRAQASLGRAVTPGELWGSFFPAEIEGQSTSELLTQQTLMRPRDIIHLYNLCRDLAAQNGHAAITESDIEDAKLQYSQWKLQDLVTEYRVNYPFLGGLFGLFQDSGYIIPRKNLERRLASISGTLIERFPQFRDALSALSILDILFDIGFLGVRRGGHVIYSYEQGKDIKPTDREFLIHPCFRAALRSTAAAIREHYQPGEYVYRARFRGGLRGLSSNRGTSDPEFTLIRAVTQCETTIRSSLERANFSPEVRKEIAGELDAMLRDTQQVERDFMAGHGSRKMITEHAFDVANSLSKLANQLDINGFVDGPDTRYFARSIEDNARSLHQQAAGTYGLGTS